MLLLQLFPFKIVYILKNHLSLIIPKKIIIINDNKKFEIEKKIKLIE